MELSQSTVMRQELRQLLTPRMIQSMEILQLPLLALEERIEQELQNNPVLEASEEDTLEPTKVADGEAERKEDYSEDERALVVKEGTDQAEDFDRLNKLAEYLESSDDAFDNRM